MKIFVTGFSARISCVSKKWKQIGFLVFTHAAVFVLQPKAISTSKQQNLLCLAASKKAFPKGCTLGSEDTMPDYSNISEDIRHIHTIVDISMFADAYFIKWGTDLRYSRGAFYEYVGVSEAEISKLCASQCALRSLGDPYSATLPLNDRSTSGKWCYLHQKKPRQAQMQ